MKPTTPPVKVGDTLHSVSFSKIAGRLQTNTHHVREVISDENGWYGYLETDGLTSGNLIDDVLLNRIYWPTEALAISAKYRELSKEIQAMALKQETTMKRMKLIFFYAAGNNFQLPTPDTI